MNATRTLVAAALALLLPAGVAGAGIPTGTIIRTGKDVARKLTEEKPLVEAELLADTTAVVPGESFHVGVRLKIRKDWHIYWKHSGQAGAATVVKWTLPGGFEASPLYWPKPQTFTDPGDITTYGYAGEVVLIARITAPASLQVGASVSISAEVSYLACHEKCVEGKAEASLTLPAESKASSTVQPANETLFGQWLGRCPADAPAFTLTDSAGKKVSLSDYRGKIVVLEWFNPDCPFVQRHHEKRSTMVDLAEKYKDKGVVWLAVNSTHYMTPEQTAEWAENWKIPYPVLIDRDGAVGHAYVAKSTPHMFIIDGEGRIVYDGAIDDDPRGQKGNQAVNLVAAALDDLLAERPVANAHNRPYGCTVKYAK